MSIHILVPQERLAELLKHEYELMLLRDGGVDNWAGHGEALYPLKRQAEQPDLSEYLNFIDELLENGELASNFGYTSTVETDAAYFENLEDILGDEE